MTEPWLDLIDCICSLGGQLTPIFPLSTCHTTAMDALNLGNLLLLACACLPEGLLYLLGRVGLVLGRNSMGLPQIPQAEGDLAPIFLTPPQKLAKNAHFGNFCDFSEENQPKKSIKNHSSTSAHRIQRPICRIPHVGLCRILHVGLCPVGPEMCNVFVKHDAAFLLRLANTSSPGVSPSGHN